MILLFIIKCYNKIGDNMNILINVDNNYLERAKDTLLSIRFHNDEKLNVYLTYDDISDDKLDDLDKFISKKLGGTLNRIKCNLEDIKLPVYFDYISKATYYRIFFPFLVNEDIDRVLYVDCDVICTDSIKEFYETDFEDNILVACENMTVEKYKDFNGKCNDRLELPSDNKYINAGVLLMNVKKYKEEVNKDELIEFIDKYKNKLVLQDQDVINKYFYGKIKIADNKYNYQINAVDYGKECFDNVLVHYSEAEKPWETDYVLINKVKPYYDFLRLKGDLKTLEILIKNHTNNYRDYLLRTYCDFIIW